MFKVGFRASMRYGTGTDEDPDCNRASEKFTVWACFTMRGSRSAETGLQCPAWDLLQASVLLTHSLLVSQLVDTA